MSKKLGVLLFCLLLATAAAGRKVLLAADSASYSLAPVIIVDAGHGGFDGGAVGFDNTAEKGINLDISKKLCEAFELYGFQVAMVREEDVSVDKQGANRKKTSDIHNRLKLTEQYPDSIYLSIHQNKFQQEKSWGTQVFYSPNHPDSLRLAQSIQSTVVEQLQPGNNRKVKKAQSNLYILSNSKVPTVLIECGFLSNKKECALLQDEQYQQSLSYLIVEAVLKFLKES